MAVPNSSRVSVNVDVIERTLFNLSYYVPFKFNFSSIEDGLYELEVSAFASGQFPLIKQYDLIYILPDMKLNLSIVSQSQLFSSVISETKPFILGSNVSRIDYTNPTNVSGTVRIYYYKYVADQSFSITWGSTIVELGDTFYNLGDE